MRLERNKKAVSPLIASVLLIVVVVGIGAVVTGIVRNYVTENKQTITQKEGETKCGTDIALDIPVVADKYKICKANAGATGTYILFTLQNTGSATVDDLQIKVFGTAGFTSVDSVVTNATLGITSGMDVGDTVTINWTYTNSTIGTLQEVKIIPRISIVGRTEKAFCSDSGLSFADLETCT